MLLEDRGRELGRRWEDAAFLRCLAGPVTRIQRRLKLGAREADVLRFAAAGMGTKDIAGMLRCSPKTVDEHWRRILIKANLPSRYAAIAEILAEVLAG